MTPFATDWDRYYDSPAPTAHLTGRYTAHWLESMMRRYTSGRSPLSVIEFGGGNSCFFKRLAETLPIGRYEIVDLNAKSLALFEQQGHEVPAVKTAAHRTDLLKEAPALEPADIVYSVGLIEHFSPEGNTGGCKASFFLCQARRHRHHHSADATWLYRTVRAAAEMIGTWAFPDERPAEIILTQHGVIWQT